MASVFIYTVLLQSHISIRHVRVCNGVSCICSTLAVSIYSTKSAYIEYVYKIYITGTVDAIDLVPRESPVQTVAGHDVSIAVDIKRGSLNLSVKWSLGHTGLEIVTNDKYIVNNTQLPLVTLTILNAVEEDDNTYTLTVSNDTFTASLSVDVNVQGMQHNSSSNLYHSIINVDNTSIQNNNNNIQLMYQ